MDAKEEMIEEFEDLSTDIKDVEEKGPESIINEVPVVEEVMVPNENITTEDTKEEVIEENKAEEITVDEASKEEALPDIPKKNKTPLIILLSILLVLDIAALVIYIIGIEKVISFIK